MFKHEFKHIENEKKKNIVASSNLIDENLFFWLDRYSNVKMIIYNMGIVVAQNILWVEPYSIRPKHLQNGPRPSFSLH